MEQPKLWMWTRRKQPNIDHQPLFSSPSPFALRLPAARTQSAAIIDDESWEEKAFAEDSSGLLGGCIWPPRSYSCSFCGREFRSAQALGGHMNVHRRDRARLKQSSMVEEEDEEEGQEAGVVGRHNSNVLLNPCPNPNPNYCFEAVSSYGEELRLLKRGVNDEEDELKRGSKLKRINPMMCAPFFVVPSLCERKLPKPEVINLINPEFVEELDLELRLGDSPKLK